MSISSQLPQLVTAIRSGALQALALQAGQVIEGKVLGAAPNGGTQVQINGQMLNLVLPIAVKTGTAVKFEVQGSGAQLRLAMQVPPPAPAVATMPQGGQPAPPPAPVMPLPAATPSVAPPTAGATTAVPVQGASTMPVAPPPAMPVPAPAMPAAPTASVPPTAGPAPAAVTAAPSASPLVIQAAPPAGIAAGMVAPPTTPGAQPSALPQAPYASLARAPAPAHAAPQPGAPVPAPVAQPATPQAALTQMVQAALPRQDSVAGLTTALTAALGKVPLPEPVVRASLQVLSGQLDLSGGKLNGAAIERAVLRSGVFQEAALAKGGAPTAAVDTKSALLALRQTLTTWLGGQAVQIAAAAPIPPPVRGSVPRARTGDLPPPADISPLPEEAGKQLLERTDAALSRVRLHQNASLPDAAGRLTADWSMDLPVLAAGHQTHMQMQIHRDAPHDGQEGPERGWQVRFAINLPGLGEVGAQVSMRGIAAGVMLWASDDAVADALEADIGALRDQLSASGLNPGSLIVRHGAPAIPPRSPDPQHLVDAMR